MRLTTWTTETVSPRDQIQYWHDAVSRAVLNADTEISDEKLFFDAAIQNKKFDRFDFIQFHSNPHRIIRSPLKIRRKPDERYLISLQLEGNAEVEQGDTRFVLQPSELAIISGARPFSLTFRNNVRRAIAVVPRHYLENHIPNLQPGHPRHLTGDSPSLRMIRNTLLELSSGEQFFSDCESVIFADNMSRLLGFITSSKIEAIPKRLLDWKQLVNFLSCRFDDQELSINSVAEHFNVSTRTIHNVFFDHGESFQKWLIRNRLEQIRLLLSDPGANQRSIMEIAYANGFKNISHFSRSFKLYFGISPREMRKRAGCKFFN